MSIKITGYNAICNLGNDIDSVYNSALKGNIWCFNFADNFIRDNWIYSGVINTKLPEIKDKNYNLRCNRVVLKTIEQLDEQIETLQIKYGDERIAIVGATTNSGVEEFETTNNEMHYQLSNPSEFIHNYYNLKGFFTTVSTACSSGIKAISLARDLLNNNGADCAIVVCIDTLAKVPLYGFNSLEILSNQPSLPFSKNRTGMNIAEGCAVFIIEKDIKTGVEIMGIGESSDVYHSTTPDPEAKEAINAINEALKEACIQASDVDYINAHATGTIANDIMEAKAINSVFGENIPVSSTKPMTGHCLGAASGIETALCCKLLDDFRGEFFPHIFGDEFDESLPVIKLVKRNEKYQKCNICVCNSFGFGGTNSILILGKHNEQ